MLSRVVQSEAAGSLERLAWRAAGGSAATKPATRTSVPHHYEQQHRAPHHGHDSNATGAEKQIQTLQARITELEATMERRVRETREAAFREGEAAGRNQGVAQVQPVLDKLAQSIHEVSELRPKLRHQAEEDLLKLALAIARKILHRELTSDPDSLAGLIRVAVEKIRTQEILRVRIHPQHHPILQQVLARIATGTPIEILPDPKLQLGGVVVETTRGEFDASVDLQLKEIERGLTDRLTKR